MSSQPNRLLSLDDVRFGFPKLPEFLGPITLAIGGGECWGIVGPNGAGKSTLLRLMAGLYAPNLGSVCVQDRPISSMSIRQRARQIAFLPQRLPVDLDQSVREVILMGRYPCRALGLFESAEDHLKVDRMMEITATLPFADRAIRTLSGGEAQRVHVAAALAQEPQILLLDEPTASLDLEHQLAIFRILRERAESAGLAVVVVTHDINLAAQFCNQVLVLHAGRAVAQGVPADVLTPEVLTPVYGVDLVMLTMPDAPDRRWIVPARVNGRSKG